MAATFALTATLVGISVPSFAAPDAKAQREIDALLAFVGQSHCRFIRNGTSYDAVKAQGHLQDKLDYLLRKDQVNTAEDFIERAGTQSSLSGQPYQVDCDGHRQTSATWLQDELQRIRQGSP